MQQMEGIKHIIVPVIALKAFFRVSPKLVNFSLRKIHTIVIPSPATPNWIAALSKSLGKTEILLSVT